MFSSAVGLLPQIVYYTLQDAQYSCAMCRKMQVQKGMWSARGRAPENSAFGLELDSFPYALPMSCYWC